MDITVKRFNDLPTAELYEILRCRAEVFVVEQQATYQALDCLDGSPRLASTFRKTRALNPLINYISVE